MTFSQALRLRRSLLAQRVPDQRILLFSGRERPRNYLANPYPFRASSHFLYFGGWNHAGLTLLIDNGESILFYDFPSNEDIVWHGAGPSEQDLKTKYGFDEIRPTSRLSEVGPATSVPLVEGTDEQLEVMGRVPDLQTDRKLVDAIIFLRLDHDAYAQGQLRSAGRATVEAHKAGMRATRRGATEWQVRAAMDFELTQHGMAHSYGPIVSRDGQVLHNPYHENTLVDGDLLLADFGGETKEGWAADVTRCWPVSGKFTRRQKEIYEVVLKAQREAIKAVKPYAEYRHIHFLAARVMTQGLIDLGLLVGDAQNLVERGVHALFFVHGLGHLLGLDVHDMEDFGDLAGYAEGRVRSEQFGSCYLRLDRTLKAGMAVTIEPGFYWIDRLLDDPEVLKPFADCVRPDVIQAYREVRGIRIEDDLLVTEGGYENLTPGLPSTVDEVERAVTMTSAAAR